MTIPSDYIVDLTSGSKSASHEYDFFESELFSFDQQIKKKYSETQCNSTTLINENSHSLNFDAKNNENDEKNAKKFKFSVVKKKQSLSSPQQPHFFTISKIPKKENYIENKSINNQNGIHIYIDLTEKQRKNEIVPLF